MVRIGCIPMVLWSDRHDIHGSSRLRHEREVIWPLLGGGSWWCGPGGLWASGLFDGLYQLSSAGWKRMWGNPKWFTCNQSHKPWLPKLIMGSPSTTPEKIEFAFIWRILLAVFHKPRSWRVSRSKRVVRCRKWHWNRRSMWTTVPWNRGEG